jgi:indolepyruvate ferredoxin oxidoreductase alpha subunit
MKNRFMENYEAAVGTRLVLQGNMAFALGCARGGFHAADGYPGTPSTEVIDKGLAHAKEIMTVNWSINEATAVESGIGQAMAGSDSLVTMKIPGLFQAADVVSTAAFYNLPMGALVLYVASDFIPSSTQHVVDPRPFLRSCCLPVIEPRSHQEMFLAGPLAADLSRQFRTPVVVLAAQGLCHSEGLVTMTERRVIEKAALVDDWTLFVSLPSNARVNYDAIRPNRIKGLAEWQKSHPGMVSEIEGDGSLGIVTYGINEIIVRETVANLGIKPGILSLGMTNPLPFDRIKQFAAKYKNQVRVFEDGYRFVQEELLKIGIQAEGKEVNDLVTEWNPDLVQSVLASRTSSAAKTLPKAIRRPPMICPGCPYRAFGETIKKMKKRGQIVRAFGDIGCSTLLMFMSALDSCLCMGASESIRAGFVQSRPELRGKVISVIGDSCECHSGMDSTRNAIFKRIPGVKVILDNAAVAMTGNQASPTSKLNFDGKENRFNLVEALKGEGATVQVIDGYNLKEVERSLKESLELAEKGEYIVLVIRGDCLQHVESSEKVPEYQIDIEKCKKCGLCMICPGISANAEGYPQLTHLCANCGGKTPVCMQRCNNKAYVLVDQEATKPKAPSKIETIVTPERAVVVRQDLPAVLRLAIRGVGGQGSLFFGKVLTQLALESGFENENILKSDTHGMAQLGGPVISTFACGQTFTPFFAQETADVLIVLEMSEILRPGFLDLLKPAGTILLNTVKILPAGLKIEDYPQSETIMATLQNYTVKRFDGLQLSQEIGDATGRNMNVLTLGILSTLPPFNRIPLDNWIRALLYVTPASPLLRHLNLLSFNKGRASAGLVASR